MKYYLAYGSNLNLAQMKRRCPTAQPLGRTFLKNHRLVFKGSKSGAYLTVEYVNGEQVPVGVFGIEDRDEKALDRYEGYPEFYKKTEVGMYTTDHKGKSTKIVAFYYEMVPGRMYGIPSEFYMQTCRIGYENFKFDLKYLMDALIYTKERMRTDA